MGPAGTGIFMADGAFCAGTKEFCGVGMGQKTPRIGAPAPDFRVLTHANEVFHLADALLAGENLLLHFYRGYW